MEMVHNHDGNTSPSQAMMAPGDEQGPGWAPGLRQLYQVVAEQPMPSDFDDLLARLEGRRAQGVSH
jgi:hypothetical protein